MAEKNSKNLEEILKDLTTEIHSLNRSNHPFGYAGNVGRTPYYSEELKNSEENYLDKKDAWEERLKDINECNKKIVEQNNLLQSGQLTVEKTTEAENKIAQAEEKKADLEKDAKEIFEEYLLAKYEHERIEKSVSKEITYQNKKIEEGVSFQERWNHQMEKAGFNVDRISKGWNEVKTGFNTILSVGKDLMEPWGKIDQAAANFAKHIGMSAKAYRELRGQTIELVRDRSLGAKYNVGMEDMIKLQEDYNVAVGRAIKLTGSEGENIAAMSTIIGGDMASSFSDKLQNFGLDVNTTSTIVGEMFKESERSGVVMSAYSKNFLDNIKLAQMYTFKNGLKGLKDMAKEATSLRLNMQQVASFADKVSTLEGATQTAAQLSVLGGSFAQYSNPLAMMYEGLNDMESLQKRMIDMYGNKAYFDQEKGSMSMDSFQRMQVKTAAEAMGLNSNELMDMIFAKGIKNQIQGELNKYGFSAQQRELIENTAQLDNKGRGYVVIKNKQYSIDDLGKNKNLLNDLQDSSITDSDNIRTIAQTLLGWDEQIQGVGKQLDATKAGFIEPIGDGVKGIIKSIGESNTLLNTLVFITTAIKALVMIGGMASMVNGVRNMATGRSGAIPPANIRGGGGGAGGAKGPTPTMTPGGTGSASSPLQKGATIKVGKKNLQWDGENWRNTATGRINNGTANRYLYGRGGAPTVAPTTGAPTGTGAPANTGLGWKGRLANRLTPGMGSMVGGVGAGLGAMGLGMWQQNRRMENPNTANDTLDMGMTIGSAALTGVAMGSMLGPWGMLAGGLIGAGYGFYSAFHEKDLAEARKKAMERTSKAGIYLQGNYGIDELNKIAGGRDSVIQDPALVDKMRQEEGWVEIPKFHTGGRVKGKRGQEVLSKLLPDEFVMNPMASKKYGGILNAMNKGIKLTPSKTNPLKSLTVSNKMQQTVKHSFDNFKVTFGDINLRYPDGNNSNIKLSQRERREISDMVAKNMGVMWKKGFDKSENNRIGKTV